MKRTVAAILVVLLLICLTSALAAGGTASDPLISKSYIDGTFIPNAIQAGSAALNSALESLYNEYLAKLETKSNAYLIAAGGYAGCDYAESFLPLYTSVGSTVQLLSGATVIPTAGSASITISAGTVINISTGKEVGSGTVLTPNQRYFCAEDTMATVTAAAGGSLLVDGYYKASADVGTVMAPAYKEIYATMQTIKFNDSVIKLETYNIDGYNYFKLRDIAYLMMNTGSKFSITTAGEKALVYAAKGGVYTAVGGELATGEDRSATCTPSAWRLLVDNVYAPVHVYNIGGNNFFKLRDLGDALNFTVDYDYNTGTVLIYSK